MPAQPTGRPSKFAVWRRLLNPNADLPHFVADHRWQADQLAEKLGREAGARRAIGGEFEAVGKVEAALLRHLGLSDGQCVIDVGCGSGRLASALTGMPNLRYHGTDVVPRFLEHARSISPKTFRFTSVEGLTIPEPDGVADFVCFFSVATHLAHHETYAYLREACRVLKPGGRIVMSFLQFTNPRHWKQFEDTVNSMNFPAHPPLNVLIESVAIEVWARHLNLVVDGIHAGDDRFIPIAERVVFETGKVMEGFASNGQSVAVLRKPLA